MAIETRAKQAVKLTPKAKPLPLDPHQAAAAQITRNALERYFAARADYEANSLTEEELKAHPSANGLNSFYRWDQGTTEYLNDSIQYLVRSILAWDPASDFKSDTVQPSRGVIRGGVLYLALPDDPDQSVGDRGHTELHILPLTSIVNLDGEVGDR